MEKISQAQIGGMLKTAGAAVRALSEENATLRQKVAHYERKEQAEKIAHRMQEKNLNPELSYTEKVAHLLQREDLNIVNEAVEMSAPQMKLASVQGDFAPVSDNLDDSVDAASITFAANLASL